ncbi:hypothetical protein CBS101457_001045 [Exobasidium rhododendri]|nr:hypothetical protein CBS101457_001045 [Exobasidium rhododendri]
MDDLLDLDWDKKVVADSSNRQKPSPIYGNGQSSSYNFDALTRSLPPTQQPSNTSSGNASASGMKGGQPATKSSTNGSDAFSSLLGFDSSTMSGRAAQSSKVSMAERLKREQEQKLGFSSSNSSTSQLSNTNMSNSAWEGLDSLLGSSKVQQTATANTNTLARKASSQPKASDVDDDLWNFAAGGSSAPISKSTINLQAKKGKQESKIVSSKPAKVADPFDFSAFEDPGDSQSSALGGMDDFSATPTRSINVSRQSFPDVSDDDILGSLGGSLDPSMTRQQQTEAPAPQSSVSPSKKPARSASPPPHVLGQIVEMGFSPAQARKALAATSSGLDVSAAIEMLVGEASGSMQRSHEQSNDSMERDRRAAVRLQREEDGEVQGRRKRAPADRYEAEAGERNKESATISGLDIPPEWQKQADQIYSQASEIGASMFSKANAFWSTAKAQAQRAIDERSNSGIESGQSSGRSSPSTAGDKAKSRRWAVGTRDGGAGQRREWQGKPKWMTDAENEVETVKGGDDAAVKFKASSGGFKDEEGAGDELQAAASSFLERKQGAQKIEPKERAQAMPTGELWNDANGSVDTPLAVPEVSRRLSPFAAKETGTSSRPAPQSASRNHTEARKVLVERIHRRLTQDGATAVETSSKHKNVGNELFRRGAYGEAELAYSSGLLALEENPTSLRRIALLNNRASARLKNGDARSAIKDTKEVLTLIVIGENEKPSPFLLYRPSKEHALPLPEYEGVNLREAYAKALLKRAQAEEMLEQWDPAKSVWSLLERYEKEEGSGKAGIINLRAAQDGHKRCSKMLQGKTVESSIPATRTVHASAVKAIARAEVAAKERIRAENAVAAAEEAEKDNLRDIVDKRVASWKNGKEKNVRALLASLENVVWSGLKWKKVGMHEVVMDNQVKRVYMRAIGKLHPDKLTPKSNTIEERMIGGAVFSVLNDAWSAANAN